MSRFEVIYVAPDGSRHPYVTAAADAASAVADVFRAVPDAASVWVARRIAWIA